MTDQMPENTPPGQQPKKGLSTGCLVALIVVGVILVLFGVCVALSTNGGA